MSGTLTWHPTPADHGEFRVTFTAIGRNPGAQVSKSTVIHLVTNVVSVEESSVDPVLALWQNRPNPFNPVTTVAFSLPQRMRLTLSIYDITGRRVAQLIDGVMNAGRHEVPWAGTDDKGRAVASGVYCYRLKTPYGVETRRMVLAR
jgi:flagellar hook assembly protein FlgD